MCTCFYVNRSGMTFKLDRVGPVHAERMARDEPCAN